MPQDSKDEKTNVTDLVTGVLIPELKLLNIGGNTGCKSPMWFLNTYDQL